MDSILLVRVLPMLRPVVFKWDPKSRACNTTPMHDPKCTQKCDLIRFLEVANEQKMYDFVGATLAPIDCRKRCVASKPLMNRDM